MSFDQKIKRFSYILLALVLIGVVWLGWTYGRRPAVVPLPGRAEINIIIIPGWNLAQVADSWVKVGLVSSTKEVFEILGAPEYNNLRFKIEDLRFKDEEFPLLKFKPQNKSYEGFLMPDTYRVYADADLKTEVLLKIFANLEKKITPEMRAKIQQQGKDFYEVLTLSSIVEREARTPEDMKIVADIFWRRLKMNWALQSCATVNYITGKNTPAVSAEDREINSPYNTYKYPGLPPGPIGNPGLQAIDAAVYPTPNQYWYFMSGADGTMHYARTLEEHNENVEKYLR